MKLWVDFELVLDIKFMFFFVLGLVDYLGFIFMEIVEEYKSKFNYLCIF